MNVLKLCIITLNRHKYQILFSQNTKDRIHYLVKTDRLARKRYVKKSKFPEDKNYIAKCFQHCNLRLRLLTDVLNFHSVL